MCGVGCKVGEGEVGVKREGKDMRRFEMLRRTLSPRSGRTANCEQLAQPVSLAQEEQASPVRALRTDRAGAPAESYST